jgi:phosphopantothenoylcysteine decarboxylase/phosphopantothenate--cysteine ligase
VNADARINLSPPDAAASPTTGAAIIVAVTGGIASYKSATLVSRLVQSGAQVTVLMTESATRFVTPLTFQALSGRHVYTNQWQHVESHDPQHIALATRAKLMIIAPATMDCLARLATGRADDIVSVVTAAVDREHTPILLAPSMNSVMWSQPSTQRNVNTLKADGFTVLDPASGWQACRAVGPGRMPEPEELLRVVEHTLARKTQPT